MTEVMGNDHFPWDDIAEGNVFENGIYLFEIASMEDGFATTGKRMPKARYKCIEPANFANMAFFDYYVVGTEEDATSIVAGSMGARSLKQVFKAAQVPKGNSLSTMMANSVGNMLLIQLNKYTDTSPEYAGTEKNKVVGCFKVGERQVGLMADSKSGGAGAGSGGPKPPTMSNAPGLAKTTATLICATCGKSVPKAQYSDHVENCTGADDTAEVAPPVDA